MLGKLTKGYVKFFACYANRSFATIRTKYFDPMIVIDNILGRY